MLSEIASAVSRGAGPYDRTPEKRHALRHFGETLRPTIRSPSICLLGASRVTHCFCLFFQIQPPDGTPGSLWSEPCRRRKPSRLAGKQQCPPTGNITGLALGGTSSDVGDLGEEEPARIQGARGHPRSSAPRRDLEMSACARRRRLARRPEKPSPVVKNVGAKATTASPERTETRRAAPSAAAAPVTAPPRLADGSYRYAGLHDIELVTGGASPNEEVADGGRGEATGGQKLIFRPNVRFSHTDHSGWPGIAGCGGRRKSHATIYCLPSGIATCYPRSVNRNIFYIIGVIVVIVIVLKVLHVF